VGLLDGVRQVCFFPFTSPARGDVNGIEPRTESLRQLHRVIVCPKVDEERAGLVIEHVDEAAHSRETDANAIPFIVGMFVLLC
jgi:hypothetical protein